MTTVYDKTPTVRKEPTPIDKNIPIPLKRGRGAMGYPYENMEIGDSFFAECPEDRASYAKICSSAYWAAGRLGHKFTVRRVDGGVRIWRTA